MHLMTLTFLLCFPGLQSGGQATIFLGFYRWLPCVVKLMLPEKRHRQTELRAVRGDGDLCAFAIAQLAPLRSCKE